MQAEATAGAAETGTSPAPLPGAGGEKAELLEKLLAQYNDGRRKTFYFLAVNLLELPELRAAMARAEGRAGFAGLSSQARCRAVAEEIQGAADKRGIPLKLRRKK